jgi:hypothetical protein
LKISNLSLVGFSESHAKAGPNRIGLNYRRFCPQKKVRWLGRRAFDA